MIEIGTFKISHTHPTLEGHFPNNPIIPGVVLLEHFERAFAKTSPEFSIVKMTNVKFLNTVLPETPVIIRIDTAKLESHRKISFQLSHANSDLKFVSGMSLLAENKHV